MAKSRLDLEQRYELSAMVRRARRGKRMNRTQLAERVLKELKELTLSEEVPCSEEERGAWVTAECTENHIKRLENFPANPTRTVEDRARLLAVVRILDLDPVVVNRYCGGV